MKISDKGNAIEKDKEKQGREREERIMSLLVEFMAEVLVNKFYDQNIVNSWLESLLTKRTVQALSNLIYGSCLL